MSSSFSSRCLFSDLRGIEWKRAHHPVLCMPLRSPVGPSTTRRASQRFSARADAQEKTSTERTRNDENDSNDIELEIFEIAGTEDDRSSFEPFAQRKSREDKEARMGFPPRPVKKILETIDFSEPMTFDGEEKTEYDPLRDGPLRYLGYANELGEAFAAWLFPGGVPLSYAVAIGYVVFDTADKYQKTLKDADTKLSARAIADEVDVPHLVKVIGAERGIDTLIWQLIASVAAPGYTIHTVVAIVTNLLLKVEHAVPIEDVFHASPMFTNVAMAEIVETVNKSIPTAVGLAVIPFIVHPIDSAVHALLNATLRPWMRSYVCLKAGGRSAGLAVCKHCQHDDDGQ